MSTTTKRSFTLAQVLSIVNSPKNVRMQRNFDGRRVEVSVSGNGNVIDVKRKDGSTVQSITNEELVLQKTIYNTNAISDIALQNARNKQMLMDGIAAEKAGDTAKRDELFNEYLNKVRVSFSVLHGADGQPTAQFSNGDRVKVDVSILKTENGETFILDKPGMSAVIAPAKPDFKLADLLGINEEEAAKLFATA